MAFDTSIPGLATTLATYLPTYVGSALGHVYDQTAADPTPDSVTLMGDRVSLIFLPTEGTFDTNGAEGGAPGAGSGGAFSDEDRVQIVALIGVLQHTRIGTLQRLAWPWPHAIRAVIRQHNRLGLPPTDPLLKARARTYKMGGFTWGKVVYYAVQATAVLISDEQITPGN